MHDAPVPMSMPLRGDSMKSGSPRAPPPAQIHVGTKMRTKTKKEAKKENESENEIQKVKIKRIYKYQGASAAGRRLA